jgi:hypothetical protein
MPTRCPPEQACGSGASLRSRPCGARAAEASSTQRRLSPSSVPPRPRSHVCALLLALGGEYLPCSSNAMQNIPIPRRHCLQGRRPGHDVCAARPSAHPPSVRDACTHPLPPAPCVCPQARAGDYPRAREHPRQRNLPGYAYCIHGPRIEPPPAQYRTVPYRTTVVIRSQARSRRPC